MKCEHHMSILLYIPRPKRPSPFISQCSLGPLGTSYGLDVSKKGPHCIAVAHQPISL